MFIDTRAIGFPLTEAIADHVQTRIESALAPFANQIVKVTVRLGDINAARGGEDKRCSVVVALRRRGIEIAEAVHADLYVAVEQAAHRVRHSVSRDVKRHLARDRRDPQRPGALVAP